MVKLFAVDSKGRVVATQNVLPRLIAGAAKLAAQQGLRLVKALGRPAQEVEALARKNSQFLRRLEAADARREELAAEARAARAAKIAARLAAKAKREAIKAEKLAKAQEVRRVSYGATSNDLP